MIKAVIYDMDGVIIDSEPLWQRAKIEVFKLVGINLSLKTSRLTAGLRVDEIVEHYFHLHPWDNLSKKDVENFIWKKILDLISKEGKPKNGLYDSLEFLKRKNVILALASGSSMDLIRLVVDKFNIAHYFKVIYSAYSEEYGKPHPSVYISTAKKLKVLPHECIAIEDSINGIIAAKSAKMKCVAVPEEHVKNDKRLGIADEIISSLTEINEELWSELTAV